MRQNLILNWVKRNNRSLLVSLMVLFISGGLVAQKAWTLRECIEYALENNIEIKKSEISAKTNKATFLQSKLDLLPSINAYAQHGYNWGRTADLTTYEIITEQVQQSYFQLASSIDVFNGFQKINSIKKSKYDYMASLNDSDKMRDDIALRIAAAYLNVLYSMELVEKSKAQLEVTRIQIYNTEKHVKVGTLPKGDLLEMQSQNALEEVNLINAQNQLNLAYLDLKQLLELEAGSELEIEKPNVEVSSSASRVSTSQNIYDIAVHRLPQIKSAEFRFKSAEQGLAIARGGRSPRLYVDANVNSRYTDRAIGGNPLVPFSTQLKDNNQKSLTIKLNIPIFNGFFTSTNISRSKLATINAGYDLQLTQNQVRKNIEQAYSDAIAAYKTYNASLKAVASFKESFKYMARKFSVGMENSLNYNMSKAQLTKSESDLISAKYDYIFKTKILDFYTGIPLTLNEN